MASHARRRISTPIDPSPPRSISSCTSSTRSLYVDPGVAGRLEAPLDVQRHRHEHCLKGRPHRPRGPCHLDRRAAPPHPRPDLRCPGPGRDRRRHDHLEARVVQGEQLRALAPRRRRHPLRSFDRPRSRLHRALGRCARTSPAVGPRSRTELGAGCRSATGTRARPTSGLTTSTPSMGRPIPRCQYPIRRAGGQ